MADWVWWLIGAGVLAAAETLTLTLVLLMLAGGAAAGAIVAALGAPVLAQALVALAVSIALLVVVRPIARAHQTALSTPSGLDALVGMEAVVLRPVDEQDGRVRLNGAEWSAKSYGRGSAFGVGTVVRVIEISGATALVWKEESL